jgi:hypothetical protein
MKIINSVPCSNFLVSAFACFALVACGGGGGGDAGGDDGIDGGGDVVVDEDGTPVFGCDGASSLGGAYMIEVVDNFDIAGDFTFPFLPIQGHLDGRVLQLVPVEEIVNTTCDDLDEGACGTLYGATSNGLGTASPSGLHSTLRLMAMGNADMPNLPALAGIHGGYRLEEEELTVWIYAVGFDAASTELMEFAVQYYVIAGDAIAPVRVDSIGTDDDCDGFVDEADEVRFEDGFGGDAEEGGVIVGDGILVFNLRR